jgi:hypothetical protein
MCLSETCIKSALVKLLKNMLSGRRESQKRLEVNELHQLLAYVDNINLLGESTSTVRENTEALSEANRDVDLQVNTEKSKYMFVSCHQNGGQNDN